jgi:hypothetical protein
MWSVVIGPASENLSNLMRRLTKHGPHADTESCPLTFHYAESAVPIRAGAGSGSVNVSGLLPLADATLRALRYEDQVSRALDVDIARHLLLVALPSNDWEDVRRVEAYVRERLDFAGPPDLRCIGVVFSGYRPEGTNREEPLFAIRLGAVLGGWDAVYRAINGAYQIVPAPKAERLNGSGVSCAVAAAAPAAPRALG